MNSITTNFIKKYEKKDKVEQEQIQDEILNYLTNNSNKELFKQIMEFIDEEINDFIVNIDEYDCVENIIKEIGKEKVIERIKKELDGYEFYFEAKKLLYSYKIKFEIRFRNWEYNYVDHGDIADYGWNRKFYYTFNENKISTQIQKILSLLFDEYIVKDHCWDWLYKYNQLIDDE